MEHPLPDKPLTTEGPGVGGGVGAHVPVGGVLVQLFELPVHGEDIHVVVLDKVVSQQVQGVFSRLQPLLILVDLLHLQRPKSQGQHTTPKVPFC